MHTHLVPPVVLEMAAAGRFGLSGNARTLLTGGNTVSLDSVGAPEALLARIDADGLDGAMVAVPPPFFRADLPRDERRPYVEALNASLLDMVTPSAGRLLPMAYLPTDHPSLAATITAALDQRWAGAIVGTDLAGHSYADPVFDDFWSALVARDLPVLIHPSEPPDPRLQPFYLTNLLGNPVETAIVAAQIVFGNVFGRHPGLKLILSHGGGVACALAGRWQRGYDTDRPGIGRLDHSPIDAIRHFHVDSIVHQPAQLGATIHLLGPERILLGSDWPFPMGTPDADHDIGGLDAETRARIRTRNPRAVFALR
ncbi:MAG: amidohydrolase family protein [Azospirillaceae bacterium]